MAIRNETATLYENAENIKSATNKYLNLKNLISDVYYIDATKTIKENLEDAVQIIDKLGGKNE